MKRSAVPAAAVGLLLLAAPLAFSGHTTSRGGLPVLIKTSFRVIIPTGDRPPTRTTGRVLDGSFIGDRRFCRDGRVTGSIQGVPPNHTVTETFRCSAGTLKIRMQPRSPSQNALNQSALWEVVEGTGRYANLDPGHGSMFVRFAKCCPRARAVYTGTVANSD